VELDEITSDLEEGEKQGLSAELLKGLSAEVTYKIDVPANRYDLLCNEGLSRALRIFLGEQEAPLFTLVEPADGKREVMTVKPSTSGVRPFVVCAILRDVTFNQERYESFIDLQDQLHRNLCRMRTLVAIGTHDLDTLTGPFEYHAQDPAAISFVPLTETERSFSAKDLLEHYNSDPACKHLKPYTGIIQDEPLYPVIYDQNQTVLSLPPIINGRKSRIQLHTKNVFIECTATDLTKANIVLDTVVAMFSEHCAVPFTVEPVDVLYEKTGEIKTTPELFTRQETAKVDFVNSLIGIQCPAETMVSLANKMQLGPARLLENGSVLQVTVPCTRSDILHAVDIAEDVGIAFGYNNIKRKVPTTCTVGGEQRINHYGDLLREEIARAGYTEVLTHGLVSTHDNFTALRHPVDMSQAVSLSNPANVEYEVIRTTLLPGLLKVLEHNKAASFTQGFKIFEISDVVIKDLEHVVTESIVGCKNNRRVAAIYAGPTSGFEIIHGLVDRLMTLSEICPDPEYIKNSQKGDEEKYRVVREDLFYTIQESKDNMYFPGRAADVLVKRGPGAEYKKVGSFGIIHPAVLKEFDIGYPASCVELDLEQLI
jgi:phenylalanyl-tRNA synthetase beta chain